MRAQDILRMNQPREEDEDPIYEDYLSELMSRIHEMQMLARGNLINAKEK